MVEEVVGVPLDQVAKLWYRQGEYPGRFTVVTKDGRTLTRSSFEYIWPIIQFKRDRCLMCHDYTAEVSDLSVGDYFYPEMKRGVPGLSAIIVRTNVGKTLVDGAQKANHVAITGPAEKDNFYMGGFEVKKHGGSYYLDTRRRRGWPTPNNQLPLQIAPMPRTVDRGHPLLTPEVAE